MGRLILVLAAALVLTACAVREQRPEGAWLDDRQAWFERHPVWEVSGRLALSDGERGGQMGFDWLAEGDQHEVRLRTLAGGRQWRLMFNDGGALLEGTDVGLVRGPDPDVLVEEVVGWPIPVSRLAYWLRGLTSPEGDQVSFAPDGTMAAIVEPPWTLEFQRFVQPAQGPLMPARIQADSPPHQVRAVMRNWRWLDPGE